MKRSTKFACLTLVMAVAMAWAANAAQAEIKWIVEGKALPENEKHKVTCQLPINEESGKPEPFTIETVQFGAELDLEFKEAACEEWVIWNSKGEALSLGRLKLGKGSVNVANCSVEDPGKGAGTVTSESLSGNLVEFAGLTSGLGSTYKPAAGTAMAVIHIVGGACAVAGAYTVTGTDVAEVPPLNVLTPNPIAFLFNLGIEEATGDHLKINKKAAIATGTLDFYL